MQILLVLELARYHVFNDEVFLIVTCHGIFNLESESSFKIRDILTSHGKHITMDFADQEEPPGCNMFALSGREEFPLLKKARIVFATETTWSGDKGGGTI